MTLENKNHEHKILRKQILFLTVIMTFGIVGLAALIQSPEFDAYQKVFDVQQAEAAPSGLVATANPDGTITLTWTADPSATSYRIYRTSTETGDLELFNNGLNDPSQPQVGALASITNTHGFKGNSNFGQNGKNIVGESIVEIDVKARRTNTSVEGVLTGCIVDNVLNGQPGDPAFNCIAESQNIIDISTLTTATAGQVVSFDFRGSDIYNMTIQGNTSIGPDKEGIMAKGIVTAGSVGQNVQVIQANEPPTEFYNTCERRQNATNWTCGGSNTTPMRITVLNNTKLSTDPFVSNTGSTSVTFDDTTTVVGHTYFYRVATLVSGVEDGKSNVAFATASSAPPAPTCNGLTATIIGTSGDDFLIGTLGDDVISGLEGMDYILGNNGNDTICGDDGDDLIRGGVGDDTIRGDAGKDLIIGDEGNDDLKGNGGDDRILGGSGADSLKGGNGEDMLSGGSEDDTLDGGNAIDVCDNSEPNDTLVDCEVSN